jgi:hypothetical protein
VWWSQFFSQGPHIPDSNSDIEALRHIEKTLILLREFKSVKTISKPHLQTSGRSRIDLTELTQPTLLCFKNELESSVEISRCRHEFSIIQSKLLHQKRRKGIKELSQNDKEQIYLVGESLLQRYKVNSDNFETKRNELVIDFISVHGTDLLSGIHRDVNISDKDVLPHVKCKSQWNLIPSTPSLFDSFETPSIFIFNFLIISVS